MVERIWECKPRWWAVGPDRAGLLAGHSTC